jgi:AAA domain
MTENPEINGPVLVIIRGVPGSGKSYLASALRNMIGADQVELLDPDSVNADDPDFNIFSQKLTADGVEEKFHIYRYVRGKAFHAIDDRKLLVWNQPFTNLDGFKTTVLRLNEYAEQQNIKLPLLVVEVEVDEQLAHERVVARKKQGGHGPDDERFAAFIHDYHSFASEGYNVVTVKGGDDVGVSVTTVVDALSKLSA